MSFEVVKQWCLDRVGEGYIYGARGQVCTAAFRAQQAAQYPEYADKIMNTGEKWDGKRVWDCAQLTRYAAKEGGVTLVSGATSQWNKTDWAETGEIESLSEGEICFLYRQASGRMQHTGVYLGDGTFVHAKGTAYGVLREKLGAYAWTHWAVPKWDATEETISETAEVENMSDVLYGVKVISDGLNLRAAPSTASSRLKVLPQGALLTVYEESSSGQWLYIKATIDDERLTGWVMAMYTEKLGDMSADTEEDSPDEEEASETPDSGETGYQNEALGTVAVKLPREEAKAVYEALKAVFEGGGD